MTYNLFFFLDPREAVAQTRLTSHLSSPSSRTVVTDPGPSLSSMAKFEVVY